MNEENNIYETPSVKVLNEPEITKDERITKREYKKKTLKRWIWLVTTVNVIYGIANARGLTGLNLVFSAFGYIALPALILLVSQVIPVFRNNYMRMHIFFWPSALISILITLAVIVILIKR